MNAFEDIVKLYFEAEGYWVRQSVKVSISKEDKRALGKPSMPRPEIDLVAMDVKKNELLLIEAKSYLDSHGVDIDSVSGKDENLSERYKLFTNKVYRKIVTNKLFNDYLKQGLIKTNTEVNYVLVAGKIYSKDEQALLSYFNKKGWIFITPADIKNKIKDLANRGWEDNIVTITAKLITKGTE